MTRRGRILLALLALLAVVWAAAAYLGWHREQERLATLLERVGAERAMPGLPPHVRRANDPVEARLRAGRALVAYYLDPTWVYEVPEDERLASWQESLDALDEIRAMAATTLTERPASWQATMLYGATAYLLERRPGAGGSSAAAERWERPLERAARLIPSYLEPVRYLAVAYVSHWQSLSTEQRARARAVLARAFEDPQTFHLTVESWLRLVPDRREALALVPDRPFAWRRLQEIFQRRHEWALYIESHQRLRAAEATRIAAQLDEAEARVEGGDFRRGTVLFHQAASALEPERGNLPTFRRILERMPAGPVGGQARPAFRRWLEWTLGLGFLHGSPLEPHLLTRLLGSVEEIRLDELALGHLLAGDLPAAQRTARRHTGALDAAWGPYLTLEAAALLERGEVEAARTSLLAVDSTWRDHPTFLRVRLALAEAEGDTTATAAMRAALDAVRRERWSGARMVWRDHAAAFTLVPERSAPGLEIEIAEGRADGQPLEVFWNGRWVGLVVAYPGEPLPVRFDIEPAPARLELAAADRRAFVPGDLTLLGPSP